jgi:hypothetical protein
MSKILEKDFRNELYKNLCDAGYSKGEATSIVSVKYSSALKEKVIGHLKQMVDNVENDKFNISTEELTNDLSELTKIKEFFDKKQAIDESKKNSEKSS